MLNIAHHFNRVCSGAAMADWARLVPSTQREIALKVAAVAVGSFLATFLVGSLGYVLSKVAGITLMVLSPVAGCSLGLIALSHFTEGFFVNHVANLGHRILRYFDIPSESNRLYF